MSKTYLFFIACHCCFSLFVLALVILCVIRLSLSLTHSSAAVYTSTVTILSVCFACTSYVSLAWLVSMVWSCNRLSVSSSLIRMRLSALLVTNLSRSIFSVSPKSSDCADCQICIVHWWRLCVCLLLCRMVLLPSISYDFFIRLVCYYSSMRSLFVFLVSNIGLLLVQAAYIFFSHMR